jgi:stage II sporulation protein E
VIKASSLPIGILDNVQPEAAALKLRDEDMVIMITDGVLDNTNKGKEAEEWLVNVINSMDTRNPQEMADYIMESVLKLETVDKDKPFGDDMTIMVTRVWKPVI